MKTLREYIKEAEEKKVAIGHFNISNLEALHGIFNAAKKLDLPVIIGTSEGERNFVGVHEAVALVKVLREQHNYPIFLNADHTYSFEGVKEAIDAGYDAVIFDGVKLSPEENIETTKKCVDYARESGRDIIVEAELGNIGQSSKIVDEIPEGVATDEFMTNIEEAVNFVKETGVDLLAPAVGNMHGILKGKANPRIDTERIKAIREATGVPLVLHGGSGITDEDFKTSIKAGMSIVHINTEIRLALKDGIKLSLQNNPDEIAPYRLLKPAVEAVEKSVSDRLKLFNGIE
ncbi:MAG: fructose-bisphosphate aldolase class II [Candidatus Paceibacteria bacterium]|jgi:fructose-bisphosphate aldolase class II